MGNYYIIANVTKKEIFEPAGLTESALISSAVKIVALLINEWQGDEIRLVSDWMDNDSPGGELYEQATSWPDRNV